MKKFGKLAVAGLLIGGLVVPIAGCNINNDPFVPPEGGSGNLIINDAYDWNEDETGSTRPELGGGYVPKPPAKEAVITIAEGSPIKFKDGKNVLTLPAGQVLTQEHFDASTLNGKTVGGVAVIEEGGTFKDVFTLERFTPTEQVTVMPFYSLGKGDDGVFGSSKLGDFINDSNFNDISESVAIANTVQINEGNLESKVDIEGTMPAGSSFRALTPYEIQDECDYTYSYRFTNNSQSAISFTVYQMREGYRWNNSIISVASDTITLGAGATSEIISLKIENNAANTNAITVIKLDEAVENLSLSVSIAVEDNTVLGPATITVKLPAGVEIEDGYVTDVNTLDKFVLPIIKATGEMGDISGWFDIKSGKVVNENTVIRRSMTIAPYWRTINGYTEMLIGSGKTEGYNNDLIPGDIAKHIGIPAADTIDGVAIPSTGSFTYIGNKSGTKEGVVVSGGDGYSVYGIRMSDSLPVQVGSAIRFDTTRSAGAGVYEFNYTVENKGSSDVHLSIYQINASSDYKSGGSYYRYESQRYRTEIKVKPGESQNVLGQYDLGSNGNWLTYIVFEEDMDSFDIGFASSYKAVDSLDTAKYPSGNLLDKNVTLAYDKQANGGIELDASYLTNRVGRLITAPEANQYTVPENVIFEGWQIVIRGKTYDLSATKHYTGVQVPSSGATLKAKFSVISNTPVEIDAADIDGFTLSADYLAKEQFVGGYFTVPEADEYTNTTGLEIIGWKDANTGETLTNKTIIKSESIVLEPVFAEAVEVKLELPDGITVGSGFKTMQGKDTNLILPVAGDITNTTTMGDIAGWYDVATGKKVTGETKLTGDITIAPYWNTLGGYEYINMGSGGANGYDTANMPGSIANHSSSIKYQGATTTSSNSQLIDSGEYMLTGSILSDSMPVTAGSAVRFASKSRPGSSSSNAGKFEIVYAFVNKGTTELKLSVYQINAGSEYNSSPFYNYESRYRVEINLQPGEKVVARGQYDLGSNGNWLTYIVFEKDVSSFSFGFSAGYKEITAIDSQYENQPALVNNVTLAYNPADNGGITVDPSYLTQRAGRIAVAPADDKVTLNGKIVSKWQLVIGGETYDLPKSASVKGVLIPSSGATLKAVLAEAVTVTIQNNNGVDTTGAKTSYNTGDKLELPANSASTTDGRTHLGWYNVATKEIVTNDTVVSAAMTIAPYFATGKMLMPTSGAQPPADNGIDKLSTDLVDTNFSKTLSVLVGDEFGANVTYSGAMTAASKFRFKTFYYEGGSKNAAAGEYTFMFKFVNNGTEEVSFNVWQLNSGDDTSTGTKCDAPVTIAAGATATVSITHTITSNKNALTYFEMLSNVSSLNLSVAMSITGLAD